MIHDWQPIEDMDGMKCDCCGETRHAETQWPPDDADNQCNGCKPQSFERDAGEKQP